MMVKVQDKIVNKEIEMIKASLNETANNKLKSSLDVKVATENDKKDTSTKQKYLAPPIKPSQASYFFDNSLMLARSCNILSQDLILGNKINITVKDSLDEKTDNSDPDINYITNSVESSKVEISCMATDYVLNGAACCKITTFEETNEFRLTQIPQETLQIMKVVDPKLQETPIYLVEQDMGGGSKKLYKIIGETYPENMESYDNKELGLAWWIGGDNFYNFFQKPVWLQTIESISAQIALKSLDTERINSGFKMNNVLFFNMGPEYGTPEETDTTNDTLVDEEANNAYLEQLASMAQNVNANNIATELRAAGTGTAVLFHQTTNPMKMEHVTLNDTNYDYLLEKSKAADQEVISAFGIPRERYMINDVKESMNSKKTMSFWEIYTKSLNGQQSIYENGLLEVIYELYPDLSLDLNIDIAVPMFSELINGKIDIYSDLFLKGLLTLKQSVILLSDYITDLNIEDLDLTNPIYEMRFINGKPLNDFSLNPDDQIEYDNATSSLLEG